MANVGMPRLSDSMEEGAIVRWLCDDGAIVARGQELVEIETDKATMVYEAEADGVLAIVAAEGDTVAVGAPIARIGIAGETAQAAPAAARVTEPAVAASSAPAPTAAALAPAPVAAGTRVSATPVARRLAERLGVDLASLTGSGPHGRIVKRDVERSYGAASGTAPGDGGGGGNGGPPAAPAVAAPPQAAAAAAAVSAKGATEVVQLTSVQRTIARRMAEAKATIPEFAVAADVDMVAAVAFRAQLKAAEPDGRPPSLNDFVVRATALALRAHPRANASYRDGAFELHGRVNVGVAVAAQDALLVPTIFDADRKSLRQLAAEARDLAERARAGTITPAELSGGTFSISNLGMFGVASFTAVVNPPQAAILAVGALAEVPVVADGAVVPGVRMRLTLTADHRILYGADAAQFLATIRRHLEEPLLLV
ncbi:MAG TPA: dihydrolipoamide acetyltransferase family protein [Conexibacter sp.]|nr:dihydrolipoamide acetyltransferase family protein [Conexibacter sp.]